MWEPIKKDFDKVIAAQKKRYEGIWKSLIKESFYFMLGIALDGGKGMGWRGYLFVWPFVMAFGIATLVLVWLLVSPFVF
jgi:hypothetical protein